jgi:hypothetical protein
MVVNVRWKATRDRALHVLARMQRGESLTEACQQEHIKPSTFLRHVGTVVRQDRPGGRFRVRVTDRFTRELQIPSARGPVRVSAKGIKKAREFSNYANAVGHFNRTGDVSELAPFKGKTFESNGQRVEFVTDPATLIRLTEADALRLDQLYVSVAGRS